MKRLFIVVLALFLPLLFAGCGQRESSADDGQPQESQIRASGTQNTQENQIRVSDPPDTLRFTSMREFLENHKKVAGDRAFEEISALAESVNFMGLERFYLPVGIPEEYQLYRLAVEEGVVALWFLPEEHLVSEGTMRVADARQQHFLFSFTRWEIDSPRDIKLGQLRITEDDLVNGAYTRFHFNNNNRLWWTSETEHIMMYFPMPTSTPHGTFSIPDGNDGFMTLSVEDLGRFTQTYTLDLTNPAA
ncbi:MAG: hypothetical protein FWC93_04770, partial [Defluviitaleaceae bacterium]|nr:hypothetical protein [Defluviitaleaceae bacterium]